eukprot:10812210-Alexandrium_andersonii.AAC.1
MGPAARPLWEALSVMREGLLRRQCMMVFADQARAFEHVAWLWTDMVLRRWVCPPRLRRPLLAM